MFISLEGTEGSGKTTHAKLLKDHLETEGRKVLITREPGWGKLGSLIREAILKDKELLLEPFAELSLFCADRAQHVKDFIKPNLESGKTVICDRYFDSTIVYQGYGRKLDIGLVTRMAEESTLGIIPDITFFFSLPVEVGLNRIYRRSEITKMDNEPIEFHTDIQNGYNEILKNNKGRFRVVDADRPVEKVHETIVNLLKGI